MRFQRLKVLLTAIFIAVILKCVAASPALSRLQMDTVNEEEEETRSPPPWAQANGHDAFEGDIKLSTTVEALVAEGVRKRRRKPFNQRGAVNKLYLWTHGIVPYEIDSTFDNYPSARQAITEAINEVQKISCIRFQPKTNQQYFVRFIRSSGCWSYIGQIQISGGQPVSIGIGCDSTHVVKHEIMHTLGFFHTNSRYDRDSYVVVNTDNIQQGKYVLSEKCFKQRYEINFQKYTHAQIDLLEAPYDMTSLMHPPRNAFSKNGFNTLEARTGSHVVLGGSSDLSEIDKAQLNLLYSCTGYPSCFKAFGMESFQIPDSQITASSYKQYYEPHQGRLHLTASATGNGAWCAGQSYQQGEWLQVDLGGRKKVTGIATQGKMDYFISAWTTNYVVWGSVDLNNWFQAFNGKMLTANFDMSSAQYNEATTSFIARYVRIEPKYWYNEICLRIELYGCDA